MKQIDFYYMDTSPPCRAVQLTAESLGIKFNLKYLNVFKGESLNPEFVKLNPVHTVPTIDDGGFILWESRAIMAYLVQKYGHNDALYPKDFQKRAKVDQLLRFDMDLMNAIGEYIQPIFLKGLKPDPVKKEKAEAKLQQLDDLLAGKFFATGNRITIADHSIVTSVGLIESVGVNIDRFNNLNRWFMRCRQQMPGYDLINKKAEEDIRAMAIEKRRG